MSAPEIDTTSAYYPEVVFRRRLRDHRERRHYSRSELARRMQAAGFERFSEETVTHIEDGTRRVRLSEALTLCQLLMFPMPLPSYRMPGWEP